MKNYYGIFTLICLLLTGLAKGAPQSSSSASPLQCSYEVYPDGVGLHSLAGVQKDIRSKTATMTGDIVVYLNDGVYTLQQPLTFGVSDGGTQTFRVIYKAKAGATPIISGGKPLKSWHGSAENPRLYVADVSGLTHVRNLYVNGKRAKKAQGVAATGVKLYEEGGKKVGILFPTSLVGAYTNPAAIEINYMHCWRNYHFKVDDIIDGSTLSDVDNSLSLVKIKNFNWSYTMAYPVLTPGAGQGPMNRFYFENVKELLDEPGEWWFDAVGKKVYYYPRQGEQMNAAEAYVPKLDYLIQIKSTVADKKVKNLTFEGLKFAYNAWTWVCENGFAPIQGSAIIAGENAPAQDAENNDQRKIKIPGAISVEDAEDVTFRSNIFTHLGASGIDLKNNTKGITIESNSFYDLSASAISIASWVHRTFNYPGEKPIANTLVKNNYIERIGAEYLSSVAIEVFYTQDLTIDHNELFNLPYTGISVGWGWHISPSSQRDIRVTNNKIVGVIQQCYDGGGIYSLSSFGGKGLYIGGNYIDEITLKPRGHNEGVIYTDEQSSNVYISNNVVKSERKWFYYNSSGTVRVDTMHVIAGYGGRRGGNNGANTHITYVGGDSRIWGIPNAVATQVMENAGMQKGQEAPVVTFPNLALQGIATSKSNYPGYSEIGANDGNVGSMWHSGNKLTPWWSVDLQDQYLIHSVELVTQQKGMSYAETRRNFLIEVASDASFSPANTDTIYICGATPINERSTLNINLPTITKTYRYVRVAKTKNEHLAIAELRVYGALKASSASIMAKSPAKKSGLAMHYLSQEERFTMMGTQRFRQDLYLRIYDYLGHLLRTQRIEKNTLQASISLDFLPKGVYLATVQVGDTTHALKIIK